jgi:DnaJ-class molecular chaperone
MAKDPYSILNIDKAATADQVKSAYRRLSKQCHPDLNPGDKESARRFHEVSAAYQLLSDDSKRQAFDRGEVDFEGNPKDPKSYYHYHAQGPGAERYYHPNTGHFNAKDIEDLFGSFFSGGMAGKEAGFKQRSADAYYSVELDFIEAATGCQKRVQTTDGKILDVRVPQGVEDGQRLRLQGQGKQGAIDMPAGDAYVDIHIKPHPYFSRKKNDIYLALPVSIDEAILGAKVRVPTIAGAVGLTIPSGVQTGDVLRLKGKGLKGGNQLVTIQVRMPEQVDEALKQFMQEWSNEHKENPRCDIEEPTG